MKVASSLNSRPMASSAEDPPVEEEVGNVCRKRRQAATAEQRLKDKLRVGVLKVEVRGEGSAAGLLHQRSALLLHLLRLHIPRRLANHRRVVEDGVQVDGLHQLKERAGDVADPLEDAAVQRVEAEEVLQAGVVGAQGGEVDGGDAAEVRQVVQTGGVKEDPEEVDGRPLDDVLICRALHQVQQLSDQRQKLLQQEVVVLRGKELLQLVGP
ncbi:hypothetical protein TYRP_020653 [Tyrophagus putrescentiae]|nr:hypothetical protein TYRP_020653 [Tyrophagus putrescentiae]